MMMVMLGMWFEDLVCMFRILEFMFLNIVLVGSANFFRSMVITSARISRERYFVVLNLIECEVGVDIYALCRFSHAAPL